jgi:hypothetical protein
MSVSPVGTGPSTYGVCPRLVLAVLGGVGQAERETMLGR